MQDIQKDTISYDEFVVLDENDNPVTGLIDSNFTKNLYNPDNNEVANISGGTSVAITEMGDGIYKVSFTPNKLGDWFLIVYNSTYFPWGKGNGYRCVEYLTNNVIELLRRILGLSQENYRIFSPVYDARSNLLSGLVKIYPSASDVDTDTNSIARYQITATYNSKNEMNSYKVKKL